MKFYFADCDIEMMTTISKIFLTKFKLTISPINWMYLVRLLFIANGLECIIIKSKNDKIYRITYVWIELGHYKFRTIDYNTLR